MTLKLRRHVIIKKCADRIDTMHENKMLYFT